MRRSGSSSGSPGISKCCWLQRLRLAGHVAIQSATPKQKANRVRIQCLFRYNVVLRKEATEKKAAQKKAEQDTWRQDEPSRKQGTVANNLTDVYFGNDTPDLVPLLLPSSPFFLLSALGLPLWTLLQVLDALTLTSDRSTSLTLPPPLPSVSTLSHQQILSTCMFCG